MGADVGIEVGCTEGISVGVDVGIDVGCTEAVSVGAFVGLKLGPGTSFAAKWKASPKMGKKSPPD